MNSPENVRLRIIGLGVNIPSHITSQATHAMAGCDRIYSIVQEPPPMWLPAQKEKPIAVTNLLELYVESALRTDNYERAASLIFESLKDGLVVGYITYGNPMAYDSVAQRLVQKAQQVSINFQVVPGISSIDVLMCDLGMDMAPGIQIYDASWLLAAEIHLEVKVAAILLQIGMFGSLRTHYRTPPEARSLTDLVNYLERFYPLSHEVFLIRSAGMVPEYTHITASSILDLPRVPADCLLNSSMYIPACGRSELREELLAAMSDPDKDSEIQ